MLVSVKRSDARVFELPGRVWGLLLGPENAHSVHASLGFAVFPPGSAPPGHVHDAQEEYIYVVSGRGRLISPENTIVLEPGTSVFVPTGEHHATVAEGTEPLELITAFSPPVVPASYEPT